MSRIVAFMTAWLLAAGGCMAAPSVVWLDDAHDFGAFSEDLGTVKCTFRGVNVGDKPVVVLSARANCGCTVPSYPKQAVAPGDTINISVVYNAVGRPGRFSKKVFVDTDDGGKAQFTVRGTVVGNSATLASRFPVAVGRTRVGSTVVPFGQTRKGRVLSGAVNVYNSTDHPITPAVSGLPDYIKAKMHPDTVNVGEQGTLSLTALTDVTPEYGTVTSSFLLTPDAASPSDTVRVSTVMILDEDFSALTAEQRAKAARIELSNNKIDFDRYNPIQASEQKLTIKNTGRQTLIIRRVDTASHRIKVDVDAERIKPGKSATLSVAVIPDADSSSPLDERILLRVNDPDSPLTTIRVVGIPEKL
ncbi:MAG: DUF1573 domain-containing protein [Muribaculaceae bacterium]|nr:DUF1573 domain-containing protein [Muribaculaceae bacterium]